MTSTSCMLEFRTEYWNVHPWHAPACTPSLLTANTAPMKFGYLRAILDIASVAASRGSIPCRMLSTTWQLQQNFIIRLARSARESIELRQSKQLAYAVTSISVCSWIRDCLKLIAQRRLKLHTIMYQDATLEKINMREKEVHNNQSTTLSSFFQFKSQIGATNPVPIDKLDITLSHPFSNVIFNRNYVFITMEGSAS